MRLHLDGVLAAGPLRAGEHLMVDARPLPDAPGVAKGESGHEEALAVLAARYAWGHGPIDEADLARWTGLTLTEARRALAGARVAGGEYRSSSCGIWSRSGSRRSRRSRGRLRR